VTVHETGGAPDPSDRPGPRVLLCPDSFKGTFSAEVVTAALAEGVRSAGGAPQELPLADGGEGTASALRDVLGGDWVVCDVSGPLGDVVSARFALLDDGTTAVLDVASASGLPLVDEERRDAELASTYGTGQLIARAIAEGARRVLVACGGSATTDGGDGAVRALLDAGGIRGATLVALTDVTTAFEDAAVVFAPQKGATPPQVRRLTERLHQLADSCPRDPRGIPRTGAAGGLAGGLWAFFEAQLVSGIDHVLDAVGFDAAATSADVIITGEGRLDAQSAQGKVVSGVLRRARGLPVHVTAGQIALSEDDWTSLGITRAHAASALTDLTAAAHAITRSTARHERNAGRSPRKSW
jgi:glycerate kinase